MIILTNFLSLVSPTIVILTTLCTASNESFVKWHIHFNLIVNTIAWSTSKLKYHFDEICMIWYQEFFANDICIWNGISVIFSHIIRTYTYLLLIFRYCYFYTAQVCVCVWYISASCKIGKTDFLLLQFTCYDTIWGKTSHTPSNTEIITNIQKSPCASIHVLRCHGHGNFIRLSQTITACHLCLPC